MIRSSWFVAASSAALLTLGACAGNADSILSSAVESNAQRTTTTTTAQQTTTAQTPTPAPSTTMPAPATEYSDVQLRAFAAAAAEIQPITQQLATATPEQRTAAADQIRAILTRNTLDAATYNAIASRAQTDAAFAARIAALSPQATSPQG